MRVGYGHPDAMLLIAEVQAEYVVRYGGPDNTPLDPLMFEPPLGSFYVGYLDARRRTAAGGDRRVAGPRRRRGVRHPAHRRDQADVRRPGRPGREGWRARCWRTSSETAAEAGAEAMILETGTAQPEAMALYESSGYTPIPSFGYYKDEPLNRCYAKPLRGTTVSA